MKGPTLVFKNSWKAGNTPDDAAKTKYTMPEKAKQTRMIGGTPAEAARELVRVLREDARVF